MNDLVLIQFQLGVVSSIRCSFDLLYKENNDTWIREGTNSRKSTVYSTRTSEEQIRVESSITQGYIIVTYET